MFKSKSKEEVFRLVGDFLRAKDILVKSKDSSRPWGGFFVIEDASLQVFIDEFFNEVPKKMENASNPLSPKILLVEPGKRLSWQYHKRRSELWAVVEGEVGVIVSENDEQPPANVLHKGEIIHLEQGERHRLIGLDQWCMIAEIWQHADPENPSDEEDIIRVEDDFGR